MGKYGAVGDHHILRSTLSVLGVHNQLLDVDFFLSCTIHTSSLLAGQDSLTSTNMKLMNACSGPPEEPEKIKLKKRKKA